MNKKLTNDEIIFECYRRMFREANPSVNFDELHKLGITKKPEFFMAYLLSSKRIEEICLEVAKENRFNKLKIEQLKNTCFLGCCPNSCRETWEKRRTPSPTIKSKNT